MKLIVFVLLAFVLTLPRVSYSEILEIGQQDTLLEKLSSDQASDWLDQYSLGGKTYNNVSFLHLGKDSLPARVELLKNARESVLMSIPYWYADEEGTKHMELFEEVRNNNPDIDLKIFFDFLTPAQSDDLRGKKVKKRLQKIGEVNTWNSVLWQRFFSFKILKNRMHDKIFVVDGRKLIMGGLNIADHYLQGGLTDLGWHDTDVLIDGPASQQVGDLFLKLWEVANLYKSSAVMPSTKKVNADFLQRLIYNDEMEYSFKIMPRNRPKRPPFRETVHLKVPIEKYRTEKYFPAINDDVDRASPVRIFYDNPLVDRNVKTGERFSRSIEVIKFVLERSNSKIDMIFPYLTLTKNFEKALIESAKRIPIRIITNSLLSHDLGDYAYYGAASSYKNLVEAGVEIYEWQGHTPLKELEEANDCVIPVGQWPGNTVHTKAMNFDNQVLVVGSHNFNTRSEIFNNEVTSLIEDPNLALEFNEIFQYDLDQEDSNRKVQCGTQFIERPSLVKKLSIDEINAFMKKKKWKVKILKHFKFIM